jgi:D-alanyl-D-alanine carboxypeptidase
MFPTVKKWFPTLEATQQTGTTANLLNASCLSVTDLLCGMLLPSGNDAAYCLAENIGALLFYELKGFKSRLSELKQFNFLKV